MDPSELAARRIAERGRDALVTWLRPVFAETVAARGGSESIEPAELERMIETAADRADGVVWRRALAEVATRELEIGLGEASAHPAVQRAQEILGVPAYLESAAETPTKPSRTKPRRPAPSRPEPSRPEPSRRAPTPEPPATPAPSAPQALRLTAVHLSGIETLRPGARNIELRFSDDGLDVISTSDGEAIGRLTWTDITALKLPRRRAMRRKRAPELIVRTGRGQASFELTGLTEEQVREHLAPMFERARGDRDSRPD
jgi:hypothetical protein